MIGGAGGTSGGFPAGGSPAGGIPAGIPAGGTVDAPPPIRNLITGFGFGTWIMIRPRDSDCGWALAFGLAMPYCGLADAFGFG